MKKGELRQPHRNRMNLKKKLGIGISMFFMIDVILFGILVYQQKIVLNHPSDEKYPVQGIDVSYYQGEIDWNELSNENIDFAFIKATEGSGHQDPEFAENWAEAHTTNLKVGAYHFFSFDSPGDSQAENYMNTVPDTEGMLPPVIDLEFYGDKFSNTPEISQVVAELQRMLDLLEEHYGMKPIIYSTESAYSLYVRSHFDAYPLWIRNIYYSPNMTMPGKWTFWQYSCEGQLSGYYGTQKKIDLNVFNGDAKDWENFCRGR